MVITETTREVPPPNVLSDLTPEIQATLAALADVETRHETERERLERFTGLGDKDTLRSHLETRHQAERTPLVQRLAELQQAMTWAMAAQQQRANLNQDGAQTVLVFRLRDEAWPNACGWSA